MANPAHEAVLRQGVEEWNAWRCRNGNVTPDLHDLRMPAARLQGIDLSHARLRGASFIRARLSGADLRHADLSGAQLHEADLTDADLFRANLENAALAGAKLGRARLFAAKLDCAQVTVADFRKADLREASLRGADFRESMGAGANLAGARLEGTLLAQCHLQGSNLSGTTGLTSRQIESAYVDAATQMPASHDAGPPGEVLESFRRRLEVMKARSAEQGIPESDVSDYNALLDKLEGNGIDVASTRILDGDFVQAAERGAAVEPYDPTRKWVDAALFRRKVDELLVRLRDLRSSSEG